ncbi:Putative amino-acid ABC transporter-binding protein YhdW [Methylovirgula sp. HY1]|nr:amino acid ABC transporter substrate-binding protein [Methylovirgula sp. HY1]QXX73630.1 Putative amino-acid ABC transporter-binding protein YhdW [Methylovirgula sp. HY1]
MSVKHAPWAILLVLIAAVSFGATIAKAGTLGEVKARGHLSCGSNPSLAGFGISDSNGHWTGFDVDYCRAIAAAIFDDPSKVKFIPLTIKNQFTALQSGDVDVLSHNTTWTESRETGHDLLFTGINFYDGQGFMVHQKLNISSVLELSGASICVQQGTTSELNLADFFHTHQMQYEAVTFATVDEAVKAYAGGRCDAFTTDSSALYAARITLPNPSDNVILPEIISKEPFSLAVRQGDDQWLNLVQWVHFAMVDAEEAGITSQNVDSKLASDDPTTRRLLGVEGNYGEGLGLTKDWAYRIIKRVGNYGEIFDRNLGAGSPLKIKRGLNALWSNGGLQYAPPVH